MQRFSGVSLPNRSTQFLCGVFLLLAFAAPSPTQAQGSASDDASLTDPLAQAMRAPGLPEGSIFSNFHDQEFVDLVTGSQVITHPNAPVIPIDGGRTISFNRVFSSKNVRREDINLTCGRSEAYSGADIYYLGDRWVGRGWTSHFGRLFNRPVQGCHPYDPQLDDSIPCDGYGAADWAGDGGQVNFEDANGTQYVVYGPAGLPSNPTHAHPRLRVRYFHASTNDPCRPTSFPEYGGACLPSPDGTAYYEVTYPDGTVYQLRPILGATIVAGNLYTNYAKNWDRAGWYATRIIDVHGNTVNITYEEDGPFPEAIRQIDYTFSDPVNGDTNVVITTELWTQADIDGGLTAAGNLGRLKTVFAPGFQGAIVEYEFIYNATGELVEARLPEAIPGAGSVGSIGYDYHGYGDAPWNIVTRVEYPLGRVTTYSGGPFVAGEYAECQSAIGAGLCWFQNVDHDCNVVTGPETSYDSCVESCMSSDSIRRFENGVISRTQWPEGDGPGKPHATWMWERYFAHNYNGNYLGSPSVSHYNDPVTNVFKLVNPDGTFEQASIHGAVYPELVTRPQVPHYPKDGQLEQKQFYGKSASLPVRTEAYTYHEDGNEEGEPFSNWVAVLGKTVTTFLDDDGVCFDGSAPVGSPATMTQRNELIDDWRQFRMTVSEGSYLKTGGRAVSYTNYESVNDDGLPQPTQGRLNNNIVGVYDQTFVEGSGGRAERHYVFDDAGKMTQLRREIIVGIPSTTFDADGTPTIALNAQTSPNDVVVNFQRDSKGNLQRMTYSGGDLAPGAIVRQDYQANYESELGQVSRLKYGLTGAEMSYFSSDVTPDSAATGLVAEARDPNGNSTSFDYDGLGRLTTIDPPGTTEYSTRVVYPSLTETRIIQSSGTEDAHIANPDQIYSAEFYDGLGRVIQRERAMPDGSISTQVIRYDPMGKPIFESAWMPKDDYENTAVVTRDEWRITGQWVNNSTETTLYLGYDYFVEVPINPNSSLPWGTTTFYGEPDSAEPTNPLRVDPDPLGRIRRIVSADGSVTETNYCGPHKEVVVKGVETGSGPQDAITRYYYDGLGQLVLVETPDDGADAAYEYSVLGNLTEVRLVDDLPTDPFTTWKNGSWSSGQVRTFDYDGIGRLTESTQPENGTTTYHAYDVWGNLLAYQDALGATRGYFFENTYDDAGRLTSSEQKRGTPATPQTADVDRLAANGISSDFENLTGWEEGSIGGTALFSPSQTNWRTMPYVLPCVDPPPTGGGANALYFGQNCDYDEVGSGPEAIRALLSGVTREDILTFKFKRLVRQGAGGKDTFSVFVVDASEGNDTTAKRLLFELDQGQVSFDMWRQTQALRLGDLYSMTEWSDNGVSTKNLYLYFVFEKGDAATGFTETGIFVDDAFVGQRGTELLASYEYDADGCDPGGCTFGLEGNSYLGNLTRQTSYHDNRKIAEKTLIYTGLNGRVSEELHEIDWTGAGAPNEWIVRRHYELHGLQHSYFSALQPGIDLERKYIHTYERGLLHQIYSSAQDVLLPFLESPGSPVEYNAAGGVSAIRFNNDTASVIESDEMLRPKSITVSGPDPANGSPHTLWTTGDYAYDGAGNIKAIGASQDFQYDLHGRLKQANVHGQAQGETQNQNVKYWYDSYGNMTTREWNSGATGAPGTFAFADRAHLSNKINDVYSRNDANGNMTRFLGYGNPMSATWDSQNRMAAVYAGQPESTVVLVGEGDPIRYWVNTAAPTFGADWVDSGFRDGPPPNPGFPGYWNWPMGEYGVGYENATGAENLIDTSVDSSARSVFTRAQFQIGDVSTIDSLLLAVDYDDGFVAWINGVEVYRSPEMPGGTVGWDSVASSHESSNGPTPDYSVSHDISATGIPTLQGGINVLAIGVWNDTVGSPDLVLVPRLTMNETSGHQIVDRYLYDANGYRIVRFPESTDGRPVISIRDSEGQLMSEFIVDPATGLPALEKDYVYGNGQLLVERQVTGLTYSLGTAAAFYSNNSYGFNVAGADSAETFTVDIRTDSGYTRQLQGVLPSPSGTFWVDESEFATDETNFIRVKSELAEHPAYTPPVSLVIDPTVTPTSDNQIDALGVSRDGTNIHLYWKIHTTKPTATKVYYQIPGASESSLLTATPLGNGVATYSFPEESVANSCITYSASQIGASGETVLSLGVQLPPLIPAQALSIGGECGGISPGNPPNPELSYVFANRFHHRDHLGSLRAVSDEGGWVTATHDYYPFGTELMDSSGTSSGGSRRLYTGHERDPDTQLDYMLARYCSASVARFLSVDPVEGEISNPQRRNGYAYVRNNPMRLVDLDGRFESSATLMFEMNERLVLAGEMSGAEFRERNTANGVAGLSGAAIVFGGPVAFLTGATVGGGADVASQLLTEGSVNPQDTFASAIGGGITGGFTAAGHGAKLTVNMFSGAASAMVGGMVNSELDSDSSTSPLSGGDAVINAIGGGLGGGAATASERAAPALAEGGRQIFNSPLVRKGISSTARSAARSVVNTVTRWFKTEESDE